MAPQLPGGKRPKVGSCSDGKPPVSLDPSQNSLNSNVTNRRKQRHADRIQARARKLGLFDLSSRNEENVDIYGDAQGDSEDEQDDWHDANPLELYQYHPQGQSYSSGHVDATPDAAEQVSQTVSPGKVILHRWRGQTPTKLERLQFVPKGLGENA